MVLCINFVFVVVNWCLGSFVGYDFGYKDVLFLKKVNYRPLIVCIMLNSYFTSLKSITF